MRKKQLPKRIEILRKAFENKWSLEAVNKELEDIFVSGCMQEIYMKQD